jgi:flagellar hook-associated protein 2
MQRDGTLSLDTAKLQNALTNDPSSVTAVLAGPANGQGVMDIMHDLADTYGRTGDGLLANKQTSLDDNAKSWTLRLQQEQDRLTQYTTLLQAQFQAMNTTVSADTQTMNYLTQLYGSTSSGKVGG